MLVWGQGQEVLTDRRHRREGDDGVSFQHPVEGSPKTATMQRPGPRCAGVFSKGQDQDGGGWVSKGGRGREGFQRAVVRKGEWAGELRGYSKPLL